MDWQFGLKKFNVQCPCAGELHEKLGMMLD
jgi:hypothetical protein